MRETFQVNRSTFDFLVVGKVFRINGRRCKVVAKHEDGAGKSSTGWGSCVPMVTVVWMTDRQA